MRGARHALCLIGLTAALAGCGGNDDEGGGNAAGNGGDAKGAEAAVRDYLRALVAKDGAKACAQLTPDYQRSVVKQNEEFARKKGADTCPELIDAITAASGSVTFEGQPLNARTVDGLKLNATVRQGGQEQNATVTGSQGLQRYELVTSEDRWLITEITRAGG
jgi:hypothetical protein